MDRYLDGTRVGPMFLRRSEVAAMVVQELQRGLALLYYDLRRVHVLWRPKGPAIRVLQWR